MWFSKCEVNVGKNYWEFIVFLGMTLIDRSIEKATRVECTIITYFIYTHSNYLVRATRSRVE